MCSPSTTTTLVPEPHLTKPVLNDDQRRFRDVWEAVDALCGRPGGGAAALCFGADDRHDSGIQTLHRSKESSTPSSSRPCTTRVYVYDADKENRGPEGRTVPLWATWLGRPRPGGKDIDMWSTNDPEWGILSTPVCQRRQDTLFVVAWHDEGRRGLSIGFMRSTCRTEPTASPPVIIGASVDGSIQAMQAPKHFQSLPAQAASGASPEQRRSLRRLRRGWKSRRSVRF